MPATNVLATFADGVLAVTAADSAAAEHLTIQMFVPGAGFSACQLVLVAPADANTTVNKSPFFFTPVSQMVRAGDGNNVVFVDGNTRLGGSLAVSGGNGNALIRLVNGVYVPGAASASAGAGANDVACRSASGSPTQVG